MEHKLNDPHFPTPQTETPDSIYPSLHSSSSPSFTRSSPSANSSNRTLVSHQLLSAAHKLLAQGNSEHNSFEITDFFVSSTRSQTTRTGSVRPGSSIYISWSMNQPPAGYQIILNLDQSNNIDVTNYGTGSLWYPPPNSNISPLIIIKDTTLTINVSISAIQTVVKQYVCSISTINPIVTLFKSQDSTYTVDQGVTLNLHWVTDAKYCCLYGASLGSSIVKQPAIVSKYSYSPSKESILSLVPFYDKDTHGSPSLLHFVVRTPQLSKFEARSGDSMQTFDDATPIIINAVGQDIYRYDLSYEVLDSKGILHPQRSVVSGLSNVKEYKWTIPDMKWAIENNQGHGPTYPLRVTFQIEGYSDAYGTLGQGPAQILKQVMTPRFIDVGHIKIIYLRSADPPMTPNGQLRLEFLAYGINATYKIESQETKITGPIIYPWAPQVVELESNTSSTTRSYKMSVKNSKGYKDSTTYIQV